VKKTSITLGVGRQNYFIGLAPNFSPFSIVLTRILILLFCFSNDFFSFILQKFYLFRETRFVWDIFVTLSPIFFILGTDVNFTPTLLFSFFLHGSISPIKWGIVQRGQKCTAWFKRYKSFSPTWNYHEKMKTLHCSKLALINVWVKVCNLTHKMLEILPTFWKHLLRQFPFTKSTVKHLVSTKNCE